VCDGSVPDRPRRARVRRVAVARRLRARVRGARREGAARRRRRATGDPGCRRRDRDGAGRGLGEARSAAQDPAGGAAMTATRPAIEPGWGVGCYEGPHGRVPWEISQDEMRRDIGAAPAVLAALGVTTGARVLLCSMLAEAGQWWPLTVG